MFILSILIFSLQLLSINAQQNYSKSNKFYYESTTKTIRSIFNSQDQITNVYYNTGSDYKRYIYRYDFAGRLDTINYYYGEEGTDVSSLYKNFTNYEYNENSLVRYQNYGGNFLTNSYTYNNRNWVTELYNSISQFVFNNEYYKNGNVKTQYFYGSYRDNFTNTDEIYFTYSYDRSNRLTNVSNEITQDNTYHLENTYDKDGNITKLIRYGDTNTIKDNFNYEYNSGTNKLNNVSGSKDQFSYDYNGNMIDDKLNNNYNVLYDYRNLITEIYHKEGQAPTRVTLYATRYYYDEAGNRIRKLIYSNIDENAGPVSDWNNLTNPGNGWILYQNEFYVRGVNENELATYKDTTLVEWYVYGNDLVGKIKGTTGYYYFKDHLGSIRAIVNDNGELQSAQDYDAWGYLLESRTYDSDSSKYKFTSKERDVESFYDYFGARYYDARIGRWGQVEPKYSDFISYSPYSYSFNNPIRYNDPQGLEPIKRQSGTASSYNDILNNTPNKIGQKVGFAAEKVLFSLGEYDLTFNGLQPKNTYFNTTAVRYIYTKYGGWIDMAHFLFYAGTAYTLKSYGAENPVSSTVQQGFIQEFFDPEYSKYSYEDLPTDKFGAIFATKYFDPNSTSTLAEQISDYLIYTLGATDPEKAPNYKLMPENESKTPPTRTNKSTNSVYTEENP